MLLRIDYYGGYEVEFVNELEKQPKPCGADRLVILAYASEVANEWQLTPGCDVERFVNERLPGKIENSPVSNAHEKASIEVKKGGEFSITLFPSLLPLPLHRRMLIAHELGHLVLHSRYGERAVLANCATENEGEKAEREAYDFADGFLVPRGSLHKAQEKFDNDIIQIAAHFMVPESVVRRRMADIGG